MTPTSVIASEAQQSMSVYAQLKTRLATEQHTWLITGATKLREYGKMI
jgi:hypothetical protein